MAIASPDTVQPVMSRAPPFLPAQGKARRGPGRGDGDRDGQAAVAAGAGGSGTAVDRGDGRDDGQAEPEAVGGGPVAEPLERLEDAADVGRVDDRAGISYANLAAAR